MTPTRCEKCNADFAGDPIPEEQRHLFGGKTNFSRVIGIYDERLDCTVAWRCPDCGHDTPRPQKEIDAVADRWEREKR
jgi:hypothetical protein